jgi:L-fucose mutarotase
MLKTTLLHPELLRLCAHAGHHARILIADGNYPGATKKGPNASLVPLQLMPGVPTVAQVLEAILSAVPVDHVNTMGIPADDPYAAHGEPPAWKDFRRIAADAGISSPIEPISKWDFYKAVESPDHILTVQTADQALWANVLLTVGCRTA